MVDMTDHRPNKSGSLRAAVFGVSDGLISNTALIMGFAGSGASSQAILLAGLAGLLAGAFSMGAGEYVSMRSQVEMFERELTLERQEIANAPVAEHQELVVIYRRKGLSLEHSELIADTIMANPETALDTMAREELGLDPDELGSPWTVAVSSFAAFAAGAFVVVLPYLVATGIAALVLALTLATCVLLGVGTGIGLLTGKKVWRAAGRQLLVGVLAAGTTFLVGQLIGVKVS